MTTKHNVKHKGDQQLELTRYFPHKLSTLNMVVSQSIAQLHLGRFQLSRQEWRILAALGNHRSMSAKELASYTSQEKMQVSRAIARLKHAELLCQQEDSNDRRYSLLSLTEKGKTTYRKIVPLALAREEFILSALTEAEQEQLLALMEKVHEKADELQQWG